MDISRPSHPKLHVNAVHLHPIPFFSPRTASSRSQTAGVGHFSFHVFIINMIFTEAAYSYPFIMFPSSFINENLCRHSRLARYLVVFVRLTVSRSFFHCLLPFSSFLWGAFCLVHLGYVHLMTTTGPPHRGQECSTIAANQLCCQTLMLAIIKTVRKTVHHLPGDGNSPDVRQVLARQTRFLMWEHSSGYFFTDKCKRDQSGRSSQQRINLLVGMTLASLHLLLANPLISKVGYLLNRSIVVTSKMNTGSST